MKNRKFIEAIPNISEGRNIEIVEAIVDEVRKVPGCVLMNYSSDKDHNRSVITYMGDEDAILEASYNLIKKAYELIDMRKHQGEHPRSGAVDVMPFVPIYNSSIEDCIRVSKKIGSMVANKLKTPVFLYEYSAKFDYRRKLEDIRRGEFENLSEKLKLNEWKADFGNEYFNEKNGILITGARKPLIAFNVLLDSDNMEVADKISKKIRESSGGMKSIKAIPIYLKNRNLAQVSINMVDYNETGLFEVVEAIKSEAQKYGIDIFSTELIGMSPMKAMIESCAKYLKIENFDYKNQIIENFIL